MSLFEAVMGSERRLVVPLMGSVGARLAGHELKSCLKSPDQHIEALETLVTHFSPDALFPIMDLTLEAEALGLAVEFPRDEAPSVAEHPISSLEDLNNLWPPDPWNSGRLPFFLEVAERMKDISSAMTGAYVIGPFTLAAELAGAEDFAMRAITDPDFVHAMLRFSCDAVSGYAGLLAERTEAVVILEPTSVMLSPDHFSIFINPALTRLTGIIRDCGAYPVLHVCGDSTHLLERMADSGADGFSLDSQVDLAQAATKILPNQVLMGNIASVEVMLEMKAGEVEKACRRLLGEMRDVPNFVLSSGCDLPIDTPEDNIEVLIGSVHG